MKNFIILAAVAVLVVGNVFAVKPSAATTMGASAAQQAQPVMMAEQELPFDRYWSKH